MFAYDLDWYRYVVFNNPDWDPSTLTQADMALTMELDPYEISTTNPDLSAFKAGGGKLLSYHGEADAVI